MHIRRLFVPVFLIAFSIAAFAAEPAQVVTWPNTGTAILQFTFNRFKEIGNMAGQKTFVTDVTAENLSGKLIPSQKFSIYVLDKKQVRIGEAWMQVDNLGPGQSAKFQISFNASGVPATVSVLAPSDIPRKITMTVNSVPQGVNLKVDGVDAVATGTDDVDGVTTRGVGGHLQRVTQHDVGQLANFSGGGAFHLHRHTESGDLGRCRGTRHDLVHGPGGLTPRQVPPTGQTAQDLSPR